MKLNRFLYFGDFLACPLVILVLLSVVLLRRDIEALGLWLAAFVLGGFAWTLIEYVVHRWIYHSVIYFDKMHDAHHQEPESLIGAPSFLSIVIILSAFYLPLRTFNLALACGLTAGVLLGYLGYQLVHHASHHWTSKPGSWLYRARLRHMAHHYRDTEGNFGIVTAFWDRLFGTAIEPTRQRVSSK